MERRIYGVETEYGISCSAEDGSSNPLNAEEAARELFEPLIRRGRSTNVFQANGGRLYLDVGAHPEYATAECDNLWDLLAQDRAGAATLAQMAVEADQALQQRGVEAKIHLFRNNLDAEGNSFGCHENYLLRRRRDFREVADALVAFFVTRQVIVGAGAVKDVDGEAQYCFSPRADQMWDAISAATTRSRPIINTRDEPLADAGSYRRLHVIVGDSNIAEPTTALKIGATELLLDAVDHGVVLADLALADPIEAIRIIDRDLTGQVPLAMADGRKITPVQLQQQILDRVVETVPPENLTELQRYVLGLWQRTISAVDAGDWSTIDTEIDFAIKAKLVGAYRERSGLGWDDARVARLLLAYHDITDAGLQGRLESGGLMLRLTDARQVETAQFVAPTTTRAHLRGRAVGAALKYRRDLNVDWVHLRLEEQHRTVALQDPFQTENPAVDELIDSMKAAAPQLPA